MSYMPTGKDADKLTRGSEMATPEEMEKRIRELEEDKDMADGCLRMVAECLTGLGCCHESHGDGGTPAMMYPEWIQCALRHRLVKALHQLAEWCHDGAEPTQAEVAAAFSLGCDDKIAKDLDTIVDILYTLEHEIDGG